MKYNRYLYMFLALCLVLSFFGCDTGSPDPFGIVGPKYTSTPEDRSGVSEGDLVFENKNTCNFFMACYNGIRTMFCSVRK